LLAGDTSVEIVKSGHQLILEDMPAVKEAVLKLLDKTRVG
jgi:hypothetical protein